MKRKEKSVLITIVLWLSMVVLLAACSSEATERLWLEAPGWSRAQLMGVSQINDPAPLAMDAEGNLYLVLITDDGEHSRPLIVSLDGAGNVLWKQELDIPIERPDKPKLLWDGQFMHFFWLDGAVLYGTYFDTSGDFVQVPCQLSGEVNVDDYAVASHGDGLPVIWLAGGRRDPGIYIASLDDNESAPVLIDPQGISPSIRFDHEGALHASWAHHPPGFGGSSLWYAMYPNGQYEPNKEEVVAEPVLAPTSVLRGPILGLDADYSYVYWSEEVRTGLEAGRTDTNYISFPHGNPEQASSPNRVLVPNDIDLEYELPEDGTLLAGSRVNLLGGDVGRTSSLRDISVNPALADELVLSFESTLPHFWQKAASQVSTLFAKEGDITDYQLLSFTRGASSSPMIISDSEGHLYISWVEPADQGFKVYLAGTAPEMADTFSAVTSRDVARIAGETTFGVLGGIILSPMAAVLWMILPLGILFATGTFRKGNDSLSNPITVISIFLSLVIYEAVKFGSLPFIRTYVPFSAWFPLPDWVQSPLQYAVPIVTTIIALWFAWFFTYRRGNDSPFYLVALFIAADSLITMAIYGIVVLGAI